MKAEIKFKSTDESFIDYLKNNNMNNAGTYDIKAEDLKRFFDFQPEDKTIKIFISVFNEQFYKRTIFRHDFLFYKEPKKIEEYVSPDLLKKNTLIFQTFEEEGKFLKQMKKNKYNFDVEFLEEGNWVKMDLDYINGINYFNSKYRIINNRKKEEINVDFCKYYNDYIYIENKDVYKDFKYQNTELRNKLFNDLEIEISDPLSNYYAICGHSGSGKTTSILFFINQYSENRNLFYINCFTMTNPKLPTSELKKILKFEVEKINNEDVKIKFNKIIEEIIQENPKRNEEFIFNFIKKLMENYAVDINEKLNIFIDQYSSKYDEGNKNIKELLDLIDLNNLNCKLFIISSMNSTCVSSNLSKTFRAENKLFVIGFFIKYNYYGTFFDDNIISQSESFDIKNIIGQFGNSSLMYYQLKSDITKKNDVAKDILFKNFLDEECNDIKENIKKFYHIIDENRKTNNELIDSKIVGNLNSFLNLFSKDICSNFIDISDYFDIYPFKYLKIKYYEIDVSHWEFIEFLPKYAFEKIIWGCMQPQNAIQKNINSSLRKNLENSFKELNLFFSKFSGKPKSIVAFYSIEPLYPILAKCIKDLMLLGKYESIIHNYIYDNSKGGFKGDLFEYLVIKGIKDSKQIMNFKFNKIIDINSLVPQNFSIKKYSYRLIKLKKAYEEEEIINKENLPQEEKENKIENNDLKNIKINYNKKKYSRLKDKVIFEELEKIINNTFGLNLLNEEKIILEKETIFLNQTNTNGKYVDAGVLIFRYEENNKLKCLLKLFQITTKKEKIKLYNPREIHLILSYIKDYLENKFINLIIEEASFYYIIDSISKDENIIESCEKYKIGCLGYNVKNKTFCNINNYTLAFANFSKFNSCMFLKNENLEIANYIDEIKPEIFENIDTKVLNLIYKPFFKNDLSIPDKYYIYYDLKFDENFIDNIGYYSIIAIIDNMRNIKAIYLNKDFIIDYCTLRVTKSPKFEANNTKLIVFLKPIKLRKTFLKQI